MKTCLYKFDPLKPHLYIVKLGFPGVYIIFLISAQKHRLWVPVRTASPRVFLTSINNLCFEQKYEKYQNFYLKIFSFLEVKFSTYLNRCVFIMINKKYYKGALKHCVSQPIIFISVEGCQHKASAQALSGSKLFDTDALRKHAYSYIY